MRAKHNLHVIGPAVGRDVLRIKAEVIGRLRRDEILAIAFVAVLRNGEVGTVYAGHESGQYHHLSSGISLLRARFDKETA